MLRPSGLIADRRNKGLPGVLKFIWTGVSAVLGGNASSEN